VDPPTISAVIPTRNRVDFLKQAVASVLAQDCESLELIVIDDASEDGTWEWLSSQTDSRMGIFRNQTRADRSAARNLGLTKAQGEFILFLDDDDLLTPRALGYLSRALQKSSDAVASIGGRVYFDKEGRSRRSPHPSWGFTKSVWSDVLFGWAPGQGQALLRRSLVAELGGWNRNLSIAEDHELWLRLSAKRQVVILPRTVLRVRVHAGQTSFVGFGKRQVNQIKLGALARLDTETQKKGERLHEAYRFFRVGQKAFQHHRYKTSLGCYLSAARRAPGQIRSPLTGPDFISGIAKAAVCSVQPTGLTSLARRLKLRFRSVRPQSSVVVSNPEESTVAR
jgi:glycosyltransferase involved in cell wall biosynthesis